MSSRRASFLNDSLNAENIDEMENFELNDDLINNLTKLKDCKVLKIGHFNINSILNKMDHIKLFINDFDILTISKSKIDSEILDLELTITDYNLLPLDRDVNLGVLIFFL